VPEAFNARIPYVSPNAAPSPLAGKQCNPWFFVTSWPNDAFHEAAGKHATDKGYKSTYLIAAELSGRQGFARRVQEVLQGQGF